MVKKLNFNSLNDLFKHIEHKISNTLKDNVAKTVKDQLHRVIEDVTYEQYTPSQYIRTHELSDISNMEVSVINNNTIQIISTRHDGNTDIARVIATGIGYQWMNSAIARMKPPLERNFYEDTMNFLLLSGKHIDEFKKGMQLRGIKVD
ncbi:hypothetical protein GCM10023310_71100 [Paenibacillus vulneris]|uniref:Phage protein n=1 Tax=Paenibacillus vulneris TaxID=1133364 RepID=A0ABW3UEW4_9BACL